MFSQYTNQNTASSSSRRLTSSDRMTNDAYFHPYEGAGAPGRDSVSHHGHGHSRSASDFSSYHNHQQYVMEDEEEEPMDILYEQEVNRLHVRHLSVNVAEVTNLELQMADTADHLMALLQREANDYSVPLPVRYYPTEFADIDSAEGEDDKSSKKTTIGPWRKRIASWMYDVVDHFQYDRNVVSIALRFIDQYVAHLLVENQRALRRTSSGIGASRGGSSSSSSNQPVKRRHFQLIAVTSLYLAIKVHGELMENDPVSGAEYDVVDSLVHEVDGRAFLGKPLDDMENDDEDDESSQESNEELRAVSHKVSDLKRRQRKGRWSSRLSQFGFPNNNASSNNSSSFSSGAKQPKKPNPGLPYKPRKRGMLGGPLRLLSFVELSRGLFTARDITDTETKILKALNYVVNPPTSRRFVGEMLRLLALCFCGAVDGASADAEATASAAEQMLGLERKDILTKVLNNACAQIEGSASVPSLSIGCLPSVVGYGAILNAVEEEFEKLAEEGKSARNTMEMEKNSPQLEDFQRHYRRYSRNQSPSTSASSNLANDRELFLEAWKDQFLTTVFHATNCFLSPDSQDILGVRQLLLDNANEIEGTASTNASSSSPTEKSEKKRSPRSPRSVIIGNASPMSRALRGNSFFRQGSISSSGVAKLMSPYDSRGRTTSASSVLSGNSAASFRSIAATNAHPHRAYYKQTSEPIAEDSMSSSANSRFARAQTPDMYASRQRMSSGHFRSNSEAFQPPNPAFFSA